MNRKLFSIVAIVAVSSALVLGFGSFSAVKAVPGISGESVTPLTPALNVFGVDRADNSIVSRDYDSSASEWSPDTYGLHGTLRP
ncbi:MAG: hypothetical protein LLG06_02210 [Desulfobacteraceae bacterium]|nr:hypothetical protein [Desulfobacteraceae bacterium]